MGCQIVVMLSLLPDRWQSWGEIWLTIHNMNFPNQTGQYKKSHGPKDIQRPIWLAYIWSSRKSQRNNLQNGCVPSAFYSNLLSNNSTYLGYFDQLIIIIMPIEEWLLTEYLQNTTAITRSPHILALPQNSFYPICHLSKNRQAYKGPLVCGISNTIIHINTCTWSNGRPVKQAHREASHYGPGHNFEVNMCAALHGTINVQDEKSGSYRRHPPFQQTYNQGSTSPKNSHSLADQQEVQGL